MAGTMAAVFDDQRSAETAAKALLDGGVAFSDISLVRKGAGGEHGDQFVDGDHPEELLDEEFLSRGFREVSTHDIEQPMDPDMERAPRMIAGVVAGMPLGALAIAVGVAIPGIDSLIIAAPVACMFTGTIVGGVIGAAIGACAGSIPMEDAEFYHKNVEAGRTIVAVLAGHNNANKVGNLFKANGGHDIRYFERFIDTLQSIES